MAIPKIAEQNIVGALKYIDSNGIPDQNKSTKYELVTSDGKKYPPKYVIALAAKLATGEDISKDTFNTVEAVKFFEARGYMIETKQEKYELTITVDEVVSSDERFTMDDLGLGDNYVPIDAYFQTADGQIIKRKRNKSENRISNQTLPRLAFQIYEEQIVSLSDVDKKEFPVCKYKNQDYIRGIFPSEDAYKQYKNSMEYLTYRRENGPKFIIYSWNIFSTVVFVAECIRRFGQKGDKFVLIYRDRTEKVMTNTELTKSVEEKERITVRECKNPYSKILLESKNIIFRGAPGTGKSYLAKQIAADIISNGYTDRLTDLTSEQLKQYEFVQFHPSYDYSDFVEGLRPKMNEDGSMGFELQDGIFKAFADRARKNIEESSKSKESIEQELSAQSMLDKFLADIDFGNNEYKTVTGNRFVISDIDKRHIYITIPDNPTVNKLSISIESIKKLLESGKEFEKVIDVARFFGRELRSQGDSYVFALYSEIKKTEVQKTNVLAEPEEIKKYVFIIDEINRGEISKILGELFFSIDPGYRGEEGSVSTQYSNMHENPDEKFYIPENAYIIGTMNDIDRSVDSFDFAMRRRFRFIEIKAEDTQGMLEALDNEDLKNEAAERMDRLNAEILKVEDLNTNYQIGASYFLKLKTLDFDTLWTDYLCPLLQEYVRGLYDEEGIMKKFARAYGYIDKDGDAVDEATQD